MKRLALLALLLTATAWSQPRLEVTELGFSLSVPSDWLTNRSATQLKLAKDEVAIAIEPFSGITLSNQVERLREIEKKREAEFKEEKTITINEVPGHYMIFYQDEVYRLYYVFMAGKRGYLWSVRSRSTDSEAFIEAQGILASFRVQ